MPGGLGLTNTISNLLIVVGYILIPVLWPRLLPLTAVVQVSGTVFFATCALTHLSMAFGFEHSNWMILNHVVQAVAVLTFVITFTRLLRIASTAARTPGGDTHGA